MSNSLSYQGGSGSFHGPKKQVMKPITGKIMGDRAVTVQSCSFAQAPDFVNIGEYADNAYIGFFFGTSQSFADLSTAEGPVSVASQSLTGSQHYVNFGDRTYASSLIQISPTAWSGSYTIHDGKVAFIYKGQR